MKINESECIQRLQIIARELLEDTGIVKIININPTPGNGLLLKRKTLADFVIKVRTKDKMQYSLFIEVKSIGQPRYVRMAVNQLQALISQKEKAYGVFGAPYMSEESIKICRENNIGFIDIAGNCLLNFDNIYISIQGKPNLYPATRPLKSLFTTKSTRAIRVLLYDPKKEWTVKDLAKEANISLGQMSNLKKKLLEYEFIEEVKTQRGSRFRILNPEGLLIKWASNYNFNQNIIRNYYSFDDVKTIEENLVNYFNSKQISFAFTLTSGASLVAPFLRYKRVFSYVTNNIEQIAKALNLKEVSSGPNVTLIEPYDEGIFYGLQEIGGVKVVSDVQLYLDLINYKERGEEAARFLLEQRLKKQW